ncbi:MAG: nitroreductase family protein [Candidatus Edwardsbacteria bacterium]|nr:nitroreductase family protein [Candidatus Edwardsbacteria bacterium]
MNPVIEAIKARRSVRSFKPDQVKESDLATVLEAGCFAPSAMNGQPWHFTAVRNKAVLDRLSAQVGEVLAGLDNPKIKERLDDPAWHAFHGAPTVVIVSGRQDAPFHVTDCAAATQNMLLAAHSRGLGSCWIGIVARLFDGPQAAALAREFAIPDGYRPLYGVALGYPAGERPQAAPRMENTVERIP